MYEMVVQYGEGNRNIDKTTDIGNIATSDHGRSLGSNITEAGGLGAQLSRSRRHLSNENTFFSF